MNITDATVTLTVTSNIDEESTAKIADAIHALMEAGFINADGPGNLAVEVNYTEQ